MEELSRGKSINEPASDMSAQSTPRKFLNSTGRPNTWWSPQMVRALLDFIDQNKGEDSIFIRDKEAALARASQAMTKNVPPQLLVHLTSRQIESRCSKLIHRAAKKRNPRVKDLWLQGSTALDLLNLPPDIFNNEELEVVRQEKELQLSKKREQKEGGRARGESALHVSDPAPDVARTDIARLQTRVSTALVKDIPNIGKIQDAMTDLRDKIEAAVSQRLEDADMAASQPVILSGVPLGPGFRNLMGRALGVPATSVIQSGVLKLEIVQARQRLRLDNFIRALIGAAVTSWVLEPAAEKGGPMYRALKDRLNRLDESVGAVVIEQARKDCLKLDFKAKIPDRARLSAQQLEQVLAPLLATASSASSATLEDSVSRFRSPTPSSSLIEVQTANSDDGNSLIPSISTLDAFTAPQWFFRWKRDLEDIFEQALNLRLALELEGGEDVYFLPPPGTKYIAVKSSSLRRSDRDLASDSVVMLALLPQISGMFQTVHGGKHGEWQVVADAAVLKYSCT